MAQAGEGAEGRGQQALAGGSRRRLAGDRAGARCLDVAPARDLGARAGRDDTAPILAAWRCAAAAGRGVHHRGWQADALPADHVRLAVSAYLARFTGSSGEHTQSDLRCYMRWCADRGLDPLAARRPDLEQYIRWMQETCRFKPSTISRRFSVAAGFYRTCVIDGVLEHSPADHVRRPNVPPGSPALGFTHLQLEALLTAARESANDYDFALVAMLGLLGLRIFEATGASIADLGEEHGHQVLRVRGKSTKVVLVPLPPAAGRAIDRAVADRPSGPILLNSRDTRMDRHAATRRLRHLAQHAGVRITRPHPHMLRHTFVIDHARCPG